MYFSHRQLVLHCLTVLATISQAAENGKFSRNDGYMPLTPMFHAHAWGYPYIATLCGWQQVYPGRFDAAKTVRLALSERVTFSHYVPMVLDMVLNTPEGQAADFGGWKMLIGGSALPRTLAQKALVRKMDVYCGCGMSESCPLLTLAQLKTGTLAGAPEPEKKALDLGLTRGMPILLAQVRVVDDRMQPVPADGHTLGEVVVRTGTSRTATTATRKPLPGCGRAAGCTLVISAGSMPMDIRLVDRAKDVIKSGGEGFRPSRSKT